MKLSTSGSDTPGMIAAKKVPVGIAFIAMEISQFCPVNLVASHDHQVAPSLVLCLCSFRPIENAPKLLWLVNGDALDRRATSIRRVQQVYLDSILQLDALIHVINDCVAAQMLARATRFAHDSPFFEATIIAATP